MSIKMERRFLTATEVRAESEGDKKVLTGYAAKFNKPSENLGGFHEVIKPGTFSRALKEKQDVRMLVNHNADMPVGRSGKNLDLKEDATGLRFKITLPDTQTARDLYENVRNGIMDQCSFGFIAREDRWINNRGAKEATQYEGIEDKQAVIRELHDVDLKDISAVTYPAYPDTELNARKGVLTQVEVRNYFPDGVPEEVAKHMAEAIKTVTEERAVKYLVTEDDGTTHLPVTGDDGKPDHGRMGAAWAALHGGYRGNKYAGPNKSEAISKLTAMYKAEGMDLPGESKSLLDSTVELRHDKIQDIGDKLPKLCDAMEQLEECAQTVLDAIDKGDMEGYDEGVEQLAVEAKAVQALLDSVVKDADKENAEEEQGEGSEDGERALKLKQLQMAAEL